MTMDTFRAALTDGANAAAREAQAVINLVNEVAAVTADGMEVANLPTVRMLMDGINARLAGASLKPLADAVNALTRLAKETVEPEEPPKPDEKEPAKADV